MILTTADQAHNFAIFLLEREEELVPNYMVVGEYLAMEIRNVFGNYTFSESELQQIVENAIAQSYCW